MGGKEEEDEVVAVEQGKVTKSERKGEIDKQRR